MNTNTTRGPRFGLVAGALVVAVATSSGAYAAGALITGSAPDQERRRQHRRPQERHGQGQGPARQDRRRVHPEPNEAWRNFDAPGNPQLQGFWLGYGNGYEAPGFRVDRDGIVHLRGALTQNANIASDSAIAVLPAGYRPALCQLFSVATFDGSGNQDAHGGVQVCPDGTVYMYEDGDDRFVALDGISFSVS